MPLGEKPDAPGTADTGEHPRASIVMPVHDGERHLAGAIESVRAQTFGAWELVIVDDGSSDASRDVASRYLTDPRIHLLLHGENRGAAAARRTGAAAAQGRFIAFLDCDDLWLPEKLETQLAFMEARECAACFTAYKTIEEDGRHRNFIHVPGRIGYAGFLKNTVTCAHTIVFDTMRISRNLLTDAPPEGDGDYPEDLALWLRILKAGHEFHGLDHVLACYRKHAGSRSSNPFRAARRTWRQYRDREKLPASRAAYCLAWQLFHALLKRRRAG